MDSTASVVLVSVTAGVGYNSQPIRNVAAISALASIERSANEILGGGVCNSLFAIWYNMKRS